LHLGFHIFIARGFSKVVEKAQKTDCETIQLFSRNPRGWKYNALDTDEVEQFRINLVSSNISPCFLHLPYLPNLNHIFLLIFSLTGILLLIMKLFFASILIS